MLASGRLFAKLLAGCALSWLAITSGVPAAASDDSEVTMLALTIYFEARGGSELADSLWVTSLMDTNQRRGISSYRLWRGAAGRRSAEPMPVLVVVRRAQ